LGWGQKHEKKKQQQQLMEERDGSSYLLGLSLIKHQMELVKMKF
jgi:hypothetical protein